MIGLYLKAILSNFNILNDIKIQKKNNEISQKAREDSIRDLNLRKHNLEELLESSPEMSGDENKWQKWKDDQGNFDYGLAIFCFAEN